MQNPFAASTHWTLPTGRAAAAVRAGAMGGVAGLGVLSGTSRGCGPDVCAPHVAAVPQRGRA